MAIQSSVTSSYRNRILKAYEVNEEKEAELMIRYTQTFTRELVFAVDLMAFVMKLSNHRLQNGIYLNCFVSRGSYDFDEGMKTFVERILAYKLKAGALRVMEENLELDRVSYEEFKRYVNASATGTEAMPYGGALGYGTYAYMLYCVLMAEMCTIAYQHGIAEAPHFGIMLMCRTFSNFNIKSAFPPSPWDWIKFVAHETKEMLEILLHTAQ